MTGLKLVVLAIWDEIRAFGLLLRWIFLRDQNCRPPKTYNNACNKKDWAEKQRISTIQIPKRQRHTESASEKWSKPNKIEVWQFVFTILTFMVGIWLARIYYKQMDASIKQMNANKRQADAAESQLKEMHEDFIADERAWVFPVGAKEELSDDQEFASFSAIFKNTGKTPAFNVQGAMNWATNTQQITPKIIVPGIEYSDYGTLPPNETAMIPSHPIPRQIASNISSTNMIFLYGKIYYDDIFGVGRWTQFGWAVFKDGMNSKSLHFVPFSSYNKSGNTETNRSRK